MYQLSRNGETLIRKFSGKFGSSERTSEHFCQKLFEIDSVTSTFSTFFFLRTCKQS